MRCVAEAKREHQVWVWPRRSLLGVVGAGGDGEDQAAVGELGEAGGRVPLGIVVEPAQDLVGDQGQRPADLVGLQGFAGSYALVEAGIMSLFLRVVVSMQLAAGRARNHLSARLNARRAQLMASSGAPPLVAIFIVPAAVIAGLAIITAVGIFIYCRTQGYDGVSFWEKTANGSYFRIGCFKY